MNRPPSRLAVVIPTYQRRQLVLSCLDALNVQESSESFEVIVVVDGSTDGTAATVLERRWRFPIHVLEQPNQGQAVARNRGAAASTADIILFLDDDMESAPGLIAAHLDAYRSGADAVTGAMFLHPSSPTTILSEEVGRWGVELAERCSRPGHQLGPDDIFSGHLSIRRELLQILGGFDTRFTSRGTFGNEDVDLSYRLVAGEHSVVFRRDAIAYQRFIVEAAEHLRRWRQVGEADVTLARLHPDLDRTLRAASLRTLPRSPLARMALAAPDVISAVVAPLRWFTCHLVDRGVRDPLTKRVFWRLHTIAYWSGVARAGGPLDPL